MGGPACHKAPASHLGAGLCCPIDGHLRHSSEIGYAHLLHSAQHIWAEALIHHLWQNRQGWAHGVHKASLGTHPSWRKRWTWRPKNQHLPRHREPLASPTPPPNLLKVEHPKTTPSRQPALSLHPGKALTNTRVPLVMRSPEMVSSEEFILACSR